MERSHTPDCTMCSVRPDIFSDNLKSEALAVMSMKKTCRKFKKGQIIFHEGQRAGGLYCISHGKVKLFKTSYEGKEQIVRLTKAGDILGYRAVIGDQPYSASAAALEEVHICMIPRDELLNHISQNPEMALSLIKFLGQELSIAEKRMMNLAQKSVRERLAETLIILKETYGLEDDKLTLSVTLSREDIANITGTATETVIRLIADFKKEGLIDTSGKKIKLLNLRGLINEGNIHD